MSTLLLFYTYTVLSSIASIGFVLFTALLLALFFMGFAYLVEEKNYFQSVKIKPWMKWSATAIFAIIVLTPSKDDLYFMLGGTALIETAKTIDSSEAGKIPNNTLRAINSFLEQAAAEKEPEQ